MRKFLDKNKYGLIFMSIVFLIVLPIYINSKIKFANIEKDGKLGIAKFVEYKRFPKTRDYYFEYYKNGNKVRDLVKNLPLNFHTEIGNFFEINI